MGDMTRDELQVLWEDTAHWSGGIYFCKKDPRLIVPKRLKWTGWTINFGHKRSTPSLIAIIVFPFVVLLIIFLVALPGLG